MKQTRLAHTGQSLNNGSAEEKAYEPLANFWYESEKLVWDRRVSGVGISSIPNRRLLAVVSSFKPLFFSTLVTESNDSANATQADG